MHGATKLKSMYIAVGNILEAFIKMDLRQWGYECGTDYWIVCVWFIFFSCPLNWWLCSVEKLQGREETFSQE